MIKIKNIVVEEFRGIHRLSLDLDEGNFVVAGPNGTGKSGVVDAIEFAFTGGITRLTGRGTSKISTKEHAPHVDARDYPEKARVILTATAPSLGKAFTIERNVKNPRAPKLTPDSPDIRDLVKALELHPEFALSRREIIKFIMVEPGRRAEDVQELLRLDRVEAIRRLLVRISNASKKGTDAYQVHWQSCRASVRAALGVPELKEAEILAAVNERRTVLRLPAIPALTASVSFRDGLATAESKSSARVDKSTGLRDLAEAEAVAASGDGPEIQAALDATRQALGTVVGDRSVLRSVMLEAFLRRGSDLIGDEESCPFCGREWSPKELHEHVEEQLLKAEEGRQALRTVRELATPLCGWLEELEQILLRMEAVGVRLKPAVPCAALAEWRKGLRQLRDSLLALDDPEEVFVRLKEGWAFIPKNSSECLASLRVGLDAIPDASLQDDAKMYLIVADERRSEAQKAKATADRARRRQERADTALHVFVECADRVLTGLYEAVEEDFIANYAAVNREDEAEFSAKLLPSEAKLGFDVDFYGRGLFPPGAYHSEGHQDGMGLCLYLALMKRTLGKDFTFAVLDDVLMSIDAGHRREVCRLLKEQFPDTQFVITTHDETWRQHMITEGLVKPEAGVQFRRWTVDDGPLVARSEDLWQEIAGELVAGKVPAAAAALRRGLEYLFQEIATRLRAPVELRGDNRYEPNELLGASVGKFRRLIKAGKRAAQSWGNTSEMQRLEGLEAEFSDRLARSHAEQWAINPMVHYSEWATLTPEEFSRVVEAFKSLMSTFCCSGACNGLVGVEPRHGGTPRALRCACGAFTITLTEKTKGAS